MFPADTGQDGANLLALFLRNTDRTLQTVGLRMSSHPSVAGRLEIPSSEEISPSTKRPAEGATGPFPKTKKRTSSQDPGCSHVS